MSVVKWRWAIPLALGAAACASPGATTVQAVERCTIAGTQVSATVLADGAQSSVDARAAAASNLVACLNAHDPSVRDAIAYDGLTRFFRSERSTPGEKAAVSDQLLALITTQGEDGLGQSFAALVLSEAVRADRSAAFLRPDQRGAIAEAGIAYLRDLRDHRGFEPGVGWRHGVAHGSDLLVQVVLNTNFDRGRLFHEIREALATQVVPAGHSYVHGEPERLARLALVLAMRANFSGEDWTTWFSALTEPPQGQDWASALASQEGLARRHNVNAFLQAVWINAHFSENSDDDALLSGAEAAMRAMP